MDKYTLISSFGKWVAPIHSVKIEQKVEELKNNQANPEIFADIFYNLVNRIQTYQSFPNRKVQKFKVIDS